MLDEISELDDYATEMHEQFKLDRRNAPFIEVQQLKKDRGGEFFADLTLDNQNRKPKVREVIKQTKTKAQKMPSVEEMMNEVPEGVDVDEDMITID